MKFQTYLLSLIALLLVTTSGFATHNIAGEITYRKLNGFTYEITITTYTDPGSPADRCELGIFFGDGDSDTIPRVNGSVGCQTQNCGCKGVDIVPSKIKKNIYRTTHTYPGPATYTITMEDPNRVDRVKNIPQSVNVPFFLRSTLVIDPTVGSNSSPILNFPPVDDACICSPFYHNPGAVDPDGDSLSYSLSVCYGQGGRPIPGYTFPAPTCPRNTFSIDPKSGTLTWDGPQIEGIYNACILITEHRKDRNGKYKPIGTVLRDMQINTLKCSNVPPQFREVDDVCIEAGKKLTREIYASDIDSLTQTIELSGSGEPLTLLSSPATFNPPSPSMKNIKADFIWDTKCSHIRNTFYQVNFKAQDNGIPISLVNFLNFGIKVIGPAPINLTSQAGRNQITVRWDPSACNNATGYEIYRKIDSTKWAPDSCTVGMPSDLGFTLIGTVSGHTTNTFIDNNNGKGLFHGQTYCYRVVALYGSDTPGYASQETCNELPFDVPVITRNSVSTTDKSTGSDSISWAKPQEISLQQFQAPYHFKVYRSESFTEASDLVFNSSNFNNFYEIDTTMVITGINTETTPQSYKIELYSQDSLIGTTHIASSVYLKVLPDDRRLHLSWKMDVPWNNFRHIVYKLNGNVYTPIDTVTTASYIDSGLVNGVEYSYKVKTIGRYSIEELPDSIENFSQEVTGIPKDTIPPCSPFKPQVKSDCELRYTELSWNNPNTKCYYKDAIAYNVYFTPILGGAYAKIDFSNNKSDTIRRYDDQTSIAGCYAVTAIDSFGNESGLSPRVCLDNCPIYELPNVFTPGGDGVNDIFHALLPYRFIESVDMVIYNRWGQEVFDTVDPDINWNGLNKNTKKPCPSGVYFYVCQVNEIRLTGIVPRVLKGHITLLNQPDYKPINSE